jgi:hypothetical protein
MRAARRRRKGQPRCPLGLSMHRARDCSSPAVHPSPQFQHKTGSPSGRPLDRKSSVSHRAPLAGHRPNSAPARQNGTEHAGRKEGAHRWRPSVGQSASGEGAPREIPVGLELSFLPSSISRGGGATRRDAMLKDDARGGEAHTEPGDKKGRRPASVSASSSSARGSRFLSGFGDDVARCGAIGRFGVGTKLRFSSRGKGTEASSIPCSPPWIDGVPGRPPLSSSLMAMPCLPEQDIRRVRPSIATEKARMFPAAPDQVGPYACK